VPPTAGLRSLCRKWRLLPFTCCKAAIPGGLVITSSTSIPIALRPVDHRACDDDLEATPAATMRD